MQTQQQQQQFPEIIISLRNLLLFRRNNRNHFDFNCIEECFASKKRPKHGFSLRRKVSKRVFDEIIISLRNLLSIWRAKMIAATFFPNNCIQN